MKYFIHCDKPKPHWVEVPKDCIAGTFRFMGHKWVVHKEHRAICDHEYFSHWAWNASHARKGVAAGSGSESPEDAMTLACLGMCNVGRKKLNQLLRKCKAHP